MKALALAAAMVVAGLLSTDAEAKGSRSKMQYSGVINLNTATVAQLDLLPGVGEKAARRIVAHREKTPFKRTEELLKVKGFGKKKFEKMKAHLAVSGNTTLEAKRIQVEAPAAGTPSPQVQARSGPAPKR
jgi:competence protein ComEA